MSRLLFAAYFLEAGFILVVAPWSTFWDHNRFVPARPVFEAVLASAYARGAVTGIGAITVLAGIAELASLVAARARSRAANSERTQS